MHSGYTIWAYSPSLNEWQRQFDLHNITPEHTAADADLWAESFAITLNREHRGQATDWQGRIRWEDTGIITIPNYLSHSAA
jgi:hypothetical protein